MMPTSIRTVGVVGTGVIGASWTGLFLARGLRVLVSDPGPDAERSLTEHLRAMWPTIEKLGLSPGASLDNYSFVGASLKGRYHEVDFIQENAPEKQSLKENLIAEMDEGTDENVVIASSSSGIPSSTFVGKCKKHPGRVLIGHPFSPPALMPLVEVVPHPGGDEAATQRAMDFYRSLGKHPVLLQQETPGFAANRLQAAICKEAYSLVNRGVLSAEDLDACVTTSLGPRWALTGPYMSNVLGGGGGSTGFKQLLHHLGPGMKVWLHDMDEHSFDMNDETIEQLDKSVQAMLKDHAVQQVEQQRDEVLLKLLALKQDRSALV